MLEIKNLSISYPPDIAVLENISISIQSSESVAVIGANGSGKTSLLLAIMGLIPCTGEVRLDDVALSNKTLKHFRQKIGFVFQNPDDQLFCSTIFDDFAFGLQNMNCSADEMKRRTESWLREYGLFDKSNRSAQSLSGGEKRLAALGAVLVMEPEVVLLDEPTAFLDRTARLQLEASLSKLKQTKIIVTHDVAFAQRMCQRVILLGNRSILYDGSASVLYDEEKMHACGADSI